jgi:hypothetical protein
MALGDFSSRKMRFVEEPSYCGLATALRPKESKWNLEEKDHSKAPPCDYPHQGSRVGQEKTEITDSENI